MARDSKGVSPFWPGPKMNEVADDSTAKVQTKVVWDLQNPRDDRKEALACPVLSSSPGQFQPSAGVPGSAEVEMPRESRIIKRYDIG